MGRDLRVGRRRKLNARALGTAARHPFGCYEESIFIHRQYPAVLHDDLSIDHGIADVPTACAVDKRFHRVEEWCEMRLTRLNRNQIGALANFN
jgi:hypothetical protein